MNLQQNNSIINNNFKHIQDFIHNETRQVSNRAPLALSTNQTFYHQSFAPRTSRNLRGYD